METKSWNISLRVETQGARINSPKILFQLLSYGKKSSRPKLTRYFIDIES